MVSANVFLELWCFANLLRYVDSSLKSRMLRRSMANVLSVDVAIDSILALLAAMFDLWIKTLFRIHVYGSTLFRSVQYHSSQLVPISVAYGFVCCKDLDDVGWVLPVAGSH